MNLTRHLLLLLNYGYQILQIRLHFRANERIGNLNDSACDSAGIHQQNGDTLRIAGALVAFSEQQVNHVERNLNDLVRRLKNCIRHGADETPEGELLRLRAPVLRIAYRIGDTDPKCFGCDRSGSGSSVLDAISVELFLW